ncbi:MAG: hypothetical protein ABR542_10105 [Desulfonatronovibrio sp.]|nr:hypothetical protein [Desulfovibrionales bacterium]
MSIRQIALELYQHEKKIASLRKNLASAEPDKIESIEEEINKTTLERNKLRDMLDAKKRS